MKQQNGGMRYIKLFFFAFLFLSALSLSAYVALPLRMTHTAQNVANALPLSFPELRVVANEPFSEADIAELSVHGEAVIYSRELLCTTLSANETDEGVTADTSDAAALYTVDAARAEDFYTLKEGRMPQNAGECVVSTARGLFYEIGDTLVLWSGEEPLYRLTVVGLAEDGDSMLCAFASENAQDLIPAVHIYRPKDGNATAQTDTVRYIAAIPSTENAEKSSEALTMYAKAKYEGQNTENVSDTIALDLAQTAVNDAQIKRLRIENQIASLDVAAAEAEDAYLLASEALEAERQEFISSMERHEAVRANQTHLITRKEAAEETFAKKEAELAVLYAEIENIYADRDALKLSLAEADAVAKEAEEALDLLKTGNVTEEQPEVTFAWHVATPRDSETGDNAYVGLLSSGKELSKGFLLTGILCIGLTVAGVLFWKRTFDIAVEFGAKSKTLDTLLLVLYTVLTAVFGTAIGGFVFPQWKFARAFSTFDGTLAQPFAIFPALIAIALSLSALFILLNIFGVRLLGNASALAPAQSASSDGD